MISEILTQEEVTALLTAVNDDADFGNSVFGGYDMPVLKHCVVVGDKVYCWDDTNKKFVATKLEVRSDMPVPESAMKRIAMKMFNLEAKED